MPKPNARSVRSKQAAILRYIASTDLETTSSHLGLSTRTLKGFIQANPKTVVAHPERFRGVQLIKPVEVAKERGTKLVPKGLSAARLRRLQRNRNFPEVYSSKAKRTYKINQDWANRTIRYAEATRTHYMVRTPTGEPLLTPTGHRQYKEIERERRRDVYAKRQILSGLQNENTRSLARKYKSGELTRAESLALIRQLWKNSDAAFTVEMEARYFGSEE